MMDRPLVIPGAPVAKARARVTKRGAYTPRKTEAAEAAIAWEARRWWGGAPTQHAVRLDLTFYMPIPASWPKARQRAARDAHHTVRPDTDNLAKTIKDALNGVVWIDDSQVAELRAVKRYAGADGEPRTIVRVTLLSAAEDEQLWRMAAE